MHPQGFRTIQKQPLTLKKINILQTEPSTQNLNNLPEALRSIERFQNNLKKSYTLKKITILQPKPLNQNVNTFKSLMQEGI